MNMQLTLNSSNICGINKYTEYTEFYKKKKTKIKKDKKKKNKLGIIVCIINIGLAYKRCLKFIDQLVLRTLFSDCALLKRCIDKYNLTLNDICQLPTFISEAM